jgi:starch-binding outer membrane protein, SusD/RagB family
MQRISILKTLLVCIVVFSSCHKDLDKFPPNSLTSADVYKDELGYTQVLAKVYGSMALTGNIGPAGGGDVAGIDEGTSDFLRLFWKAQELSTDESVVAWNDPGIQDFHNMNWSSSNPMLKGLYYRCVYTITLCNEFIRESAPAKVSSRGITGDAANKIKRMRAESKFVRAFQYWVLLDLYANPTFVVETDGIGSFLPPQTNRPALFKYIEDQLNEVLPDLADPKTNEYGRADKAAAWSLLARLYLNSEKVYGTGAKYNEAVTNAKKVIDAGYSLLSDYRWLLLADNNLSNPEFIWTLNYDGIKTKNFGGTTFLVNASVGGDMDNKVSGLGGWGGIRATKNLPLLFPDFTGDIDKRAQFVQGSQNLEINNISEFKDGLGVKKYRNVTRAGAFGSDPDRTFADIDFPVFRLAEMYLIYAEGVKRGASTGTSALALTYINNLRQRAYGNSLGNINAIDLTTDFILDERARELYWEGFRRTDLIRYDKFTEASYLWPWKGGVRNGTGVASFRKTYPIPDSEIASNPNIKQNQGY